MAITMLDSLTSEKNIGSFISKNIFDALVNYYDRTIKFVTNDSEGSDDPQDFTTRWRSYFNLLLMNRFYDKLLKQKTVNEREQIKNMTSLQQVVYKPLAEMFIVRSIQYLESDDMRDNYQMMIPTEEIEIGHEQSLLFTLQADIKNNFNTYKVRQ